MKSWIKAVLAATLGLAPITASAGGIPESNDPIKIMYADWSSININGQIAGQILKKLGYTVQYIPADNSARYPAFENGDLTIAMETWATTQKAAFETSLATGKIVDLGSLGPAAREDWWFPDYMKEKCPGLPDWHALRDPKCAEAFSAPETAPKGRYLAGPPSWGGHDEERVDALGLPFVVVHAGSDAAMFAELKSAYERKAPIMLWVYVPSWVPSKYNGEFVEFPKYTDACYQDPKWGVNPDKAYDCAKPTGWIKKMGWADGEKKWPCAYSVVRKYTIDAAELDALVAEVDLEGQKIEDVAKAWVDANAAKWKPCTSCAM